MSDKSIIVRQEMQNPDAHSGPSQTSKNFSEQLYQLPKLPSEQQLSTDTDWNDLILLNTVKNDPNIERLQKDIFEVWDILQEWISLQEERVHEQQSQIYGILSDISALMSRLRKQKLNEQKAIEGQSGDLTRTSHIKKAVQDLENQLQAFERRIQCLDKQLR